MDLLGVHSPQCSFPKKSNYKKLQSNAQLDWEKSTNYINQDIIEPNTIGYTEVHLNK